MTVADTQTTSRTQATQARPAVRRREKASEFYAYFGLPIVIAGPILTVAMGYSMRPDLPLTFHIAMGLIPAIGLLAILRWFILLFSEQSYGVRNLETQRNVFIWGGVAVFAVADFAIMFTDFFFKH